MCAPNSDLSGGRLIAEFVGPLLHLVEASPVSVHKGDGACGASRCASGVAATQIALLNFAGLLHVVDGAEGASDGAHLAAHTRGFVHHHGARNFVMLDRLDRASVHTPGFVALRAGVGHFFTGLVKVKHLDARLGRGEGAVVFKRASHLALQAAGAFVGVDVQDFLHLRLLKLCKELHRILQNPLTPPIRNNPSFHRFTPLNFST